MITLIKKPSLFLWALLFASTVLTPILVYAATGNKATVPSSYIIKSMSWEQTASENILRIEGGVPPTYTMYELFNPYRVIVDIADASFDPAVDMSKDLSKGSVTLIKAEILDDQEPTIARIEIFLSEESSFTIDRLGQDIFVKFAKSAEEQQPRAPVVEQPVASQPVVSNTPAADKSLEALIEYSTELREAAESANTVHANPTISEEAIAETTLPQSENSGETPAIESEEASLLLDIEVEYTPTATRVFLKANGPIKNFEKVHLAKNIRANRPDRMYIDVKNVKLAGPIQPKDVGTALAQIRTGARTDGFRVVFDSSLDTLFDYSIAEQPDGMLITIDEPSAATAVLAELMNEAINNTADPEPAPAPEPEIFASNIAQDTIPEDMLSPPVETEVDEQEKEIIQPQETAPIADSELTFAGYTKQRITVDFYKIDLHNVFRLFGEISNLNMVVDEAVGGSLTLSLNDVPWDFAMEIILNLKDLQKEERFNTIVISPKSKNFEWPKQALSNVEFKTEIKLDVQQQAEEAIKIVSRQEIPETVVMAKNLIYQAQQSEKLGNYTAALTYYEDAFKKWPDNTIIAKRISAICLVHLGQNAKAVHYAKAALRANPIDYDSALQAAIGLARMKKSAESRKYFEKAISGSKPSSEALSSYAAFSEENQDYDHALKLLEQHEDFHGDSLVTMISRARIHDKQGQTELANTEYQTILLSGYEIPADLNRYIKGRASLANQ